MADAWYAFNEFKYASLILLFLSVTVAVITYRFITRRLRRYAGRHAFKPQNVLTFFFVWRYTFMFVIVIVLLLLFSQAFALMGLTLLFASSLLSWALRNPIMNLAGWLLIVVRRPYRIGDRVILGGMVGDVKDITITYTLLEQVGGTVGSEEKSGRSLLVPNQHLFNWTIVNYTLDDKFILDEVPVRLTFDSNLELAEEIMLRAAKQVTSDIIEETGVEPFVRFEMIPSGVVARVRYRVQAVRRPEISTRIVDQVFREFAAATDIRFAYVMSETHMRSSDSDNPPPPQHPRWLEDGLLRPWFSAVRGQEVNQPQH